MAGNLATKQKNKAVGWGFHSNNKNVVAMQNYCGRQNLHNQNTMSTPLIYRAETRMNTVFSGGGGANLKA